MRIERVNPPSFTSYISVDEAKSHLRVLNADDSENAYISALINAACDYVEGIGKFAIAEGYESDSEYLLTMEGWPKADGSGDVIVTIPIANVSSIRRITCTNAASEQLFLDSNQTDFNVLEARSPWAVKLINRPQLLRDNDPVRLEFQASFFNGIPNSIKQAVLIAIGQMYEFRQEEIVGTISRSASITIENLIRPYKLFMP